MMNAALALALQAAAPAAACPTVEDLWTIPGKPLILTVEQAGCRIDGFVQEKDGTIAWRGFWTGERWLMSAHGRREGCASTAWGYVDAAAPDRLLINVRGGDGFCGGGRSFNATMAYRRLTPETWQPPAVE